jgi:mycothiol synthase
MVAELPEGFTARPASMGDLEAAVALFNACSRELIGKEQYEVDETRVEWSTPKFNLKTDTQVVLTPDGEIVGWVEVWDIAEPHVRISIWGRVHPNYRGQGIGTYLIRWAEDRASQAIPKAPPGSRVVVDHGVLHQDKLAQELLEKEGFKVVRHFWRMLIEMDKPPPAPKWPEGITVRTFVPQRDDRAVVAAVREAFKDHWGYIESPFEEQLQRWRHWINNSEDFDPSLWFLAMDGDEIAGVSLCWPKIPEDPNMGEVSTLGVRRPWRRRGLALALLHHSFGEFYRRGKTKVCLGVDSKSLTGATRLYQKAGMHVDRQHHIYEKELRSGKDLSTQSIR